MIQTRRLLFFAAVASLLCATAIHADDASEARKRFAEGAKALEANRYREAALHFESAARLRAHPIALFSAATTWDKAEEPARAADNYARAIELPGLSTKDQKTAHERLTSLEQSLGTAAVSGPSGLVVQFEHSTEASPPVRLHGAPGIHTLLIVRDGNVERRDVILKAGETASVSISEPAPVPPPAPIESAPAASVSATPVASAFSPAVDLPSATAPAATLSTRKIVGYSAMGAGVLTAGVAVWLGVKTLSARDDYVSNPSQGGYDHATSLRLWTNVAWAGAAVLGGVGAALAFWPSSNSQQGEQRTSLTLVPTPTGVLLRGDF